VTIQSGIDPTIGATKAHAMTKPAWRATLARVWRTQDFWAGVVFVVAGAVGLYLSQNLSFGTSTRMGAGYLPRVLSWSVLGLGVVLCVRSLIGGAAVDRDFRYRPIVLVLAGIGVFGILIERGGLAITVFVTALVTTTALRDIRWIEAVIFSAGIALFSVLVFVQGLNLPIPTWPR
jgi:Tripartite tricarboxylate transporter TctB family